MSLLDLPERLLQRAAHRLLSEVGRAWVCTNGDVIQVLAPGMINPHEGPDVTHIAVLHNGTVYIGDAEFHVHASSWIHHGHDADSRYRDVMIHVILSEDRHVACARWTLVLPHDEMGQALRMHVSIPTPNSTAIDEIQRAAMLRLNRATALARAAIGRVGIVDSLRVLTSNYFDRLHAKRRHPTPTDLGQIIRSAITESSLGLFARSIDDVPIDQILTALECADRTRISLEGAALRREIVVNVILPVSCARARNDQRAVLLQWYWAARSIHSYGILRRRFPSQDQSFVWQQQGMLEFMRRYG